MRSMALYQSARAHTSGLEQTTGTAKESALGPREAPRFIECKRITPTIGAEVGLFARKQLSHLLCGDISGLEGSVEQHKGAGEFQETNLRQAFFDEVYAALVKYQVLVFRDQSMFNAEAHLKLAESFGSVDGVVHPVYPTAAEGCTTTVASCSSEQGSGAAESGPGRATMISSTSGRSGSTSSGSAPTPAVATSSSSSKIVRLEHGGTTGRVPDTDTWHTDMTFLANPPCTSVLFGKRIPAVGGDTLFSSQAAAYDGLSEGMKADIAKLEAIHDFGSFRNDFVQDAAARVDGGGEDPLVRGYCKFGNAVHPVVKTHPTTGRAHLYVNPGFTVQVVGMNSTESQKLLQFLFDHSQKPEYQMRLRWTDGCVVLWDNRSTMHYAVADYLPAYRCMHRITVADDRRARGRG